MTLKPHTWYWIDWYHSNLPTVDDFKLEQMREFPPPRQSYIAYCRTDKNGEILVPKLVGKVFHLPEGWDKV